jgi:hypothetical protein
MQFGNGDAFEQPPQKVEFIRALFGIESPGRIGLSYDSRQRTTAR